MKGELKKYIHYYLGTGLMFEIENSIGAKQYAEFTISDAPFLLKKKLGATPVMNRLDSLTKPIVVEGYNGGKEFVPLKHLAHWIFDVRGEWFDEYESAEGWVEVMVLDDIMFMPFMAVKKLISWHFWIGSQDLFDQGLIIDKAS